MKDNNQIRFNNWTDMSPHSHPNGYYRQQHVGPQHEACQLQQEVTRPKARFKPTLTEKSGVDGGATYLGQPLHLYLPRDSFTSFIIAFACRAQKSWGALSLFNQIEWNCSNRFIWLQRIWKILKNFECSKKPKSAVWSNYLSHNSISDPTKDKFSSQTLLAIHERSW